jgi:D-alanyl-lipoteichoic acid acyltransferase DltB (MBOAT superfamily)
MNYLAKVINDLRALQTSLVRSGFLIWSISSLLIIAFTFELSLGKNLMKILIPLGVVSCLAFLHNSRRIKNTEYLLFFSISITSLFGLTQTLTGSHAEGSNILLYGLSFYTASIAYLIVINSFNYSKIFSISNPLLLFTGPIALFITSISHKRIANRIKYYFPFIVIGVFMFQVVGSPLTEFFYLIDNTDIVSSILFASIFELFVYMNFCGLSLLIYGLFGVLGYRIPLNFRQPFSSSNIVEFWRGWHTSLSQVLKVLFYNKLRAKFSLFIGLVGVFVSSAMWHGVTLNFFIWGLTHAILFWFSLCLMKFGKVILPLLMMPIIIVLGRLIFADSNTERLIEKLFFKYDGFGAAISALSAPTHSHISLILGFCIIFMEFAFRKATIMRKRNYKYLRAPRILVILCVVGLLFISNTGVDYAVYGQR